MRASIFIVGLAATLAPSSFAEYRRAWSTTNAKGDGKQDEPPAKSPETVLAETVAERDARIAQLEGRIGELENHLTGLATAAEAQEKELTEAKARLAETKPTAPKKFDPLAAMAAGAGVDIEDVIWRKQAGLSPEMAVLAAKQQRDYLASPHKKIRDLKLAKQPVPPELLAQVAPQSALPARPQPANAPE